MDETSLNLLGIQTVEFKKAKSWYRKALYAHFAVFSMAVLSVLIVNELIIYSLSVVALMSTTLRVLFEYRANSHMSIAHRARRALLLSNGLGYQVDYCAIYDLIARTEMGEDDLQTWANEYYFSTVTEPGKSRLADLLQENAFFTKHLCLISARRMWMYFGIALSSSFIVLLLLPPFNLAKWGVAIARIVIAFLAFLFAVDLLESGLCFSHASSDVAVVYNTLTKAQDMEEGELLALIGDYNSAVQAAPPVPNSVYDKHRERLTQLYSSEVSKSGR